MTTREEATKKLEASLVDLHPNTGDLVLKFAAALAEKLAAAEIKYKYSDEWSSGHWEELCRDHLHHHINKGDPRDVAAYCAFMWHHGWSTNSPPTFGTVS
jgi:hypothetical protein